MFAQMSDNVISLAELLDENSIIYPISRVGKEHMDAVRATLNPYPNVDTGGIQINPGGTNENILKYISSDNREEILKSRMKPIGYEELKPYLHCDFFLFNFVSGFEISLDAIKRVRENNQCLVLVDVHNKVLGMRKDGQRFSRTWKEWKNWLRNADIVQMNERECALTIGREITNVDEFITSAIEIMEQGPSQVLITLGSHGSLAVYRERQEYYYVVVPVTSHQALDTSGCGDSFTAGYIYGIANGKSPVIAAAFANVVAGENCERQGCSRNNKTVEELMERMSAEFSDIVNKANQGWKGNKWFPKT